MMLAYRVDFTQDDNHTLLVTSPSFPELTTYGSDRDDAERHAVDAIEVALAERIAAGEPIPRMDDVIPVGSMLVRVPALTAIKVQLYLACREEEVTRAELARRLDWHREQVDRLFRLDHGSRLDQLEAAFQALGRQLDIEVHAAA